MKDIIKINNRKIGRSQDVFIIAEIGLNHNGNLDTAKRLVNEAKSAGADAVKFQTYITEKRVPKDSPIFDILKGCELDEPAHIELKRECDALGIIFFSTPFDRESVLMLDKLGVDAYKVASFDIVNRALLRDIAVTGKAIIISRGMADKGEIDSAVEIMESAKAQYALLHCISAYPAEPKDANLNVIQRLSRIYGCPVGYSDHTLGIDVPVSAVAAGAKLIEKHFTLDKLMDGPDHKLSSDPAELSRMIGSIRRLEGVLGEESFKTYEAEKATLAYRRVTG